MRLGLFGGTFDPPHLGHWLVAVDAFEALELDRLLFVPAHQQPLKGSATRASAADRLAMVEAMVSGDPRFGVDAIEIEREGLSYTVDTLAAVRRRPRISALFFLIGADVLGSFHQWRDPERVQEMATLVVLQRPGAGNAVPLPPGVRAMELSTRRVELSSTEVRERVAMGRSIRGFVPEAVAAYVARSGLYR